MVDERDDPLAAIEAELAVDPSPEFAARVRAEIHVRSEQRSALTMWSRRWVVVPLALLAVGVTMPMWRSDRRAEQVASPAATGSPALTSVAQGSRGATGVPQAIVVARPPRLSEQVGSTARLAPAKTLEVVVAADQIVGLRRLIADVRAGQVPAEPSPVPSADISELAPVTPIEIRPIVVALLSEDSGPTPGEIQ